jgi:hypothetical protein
VIRRSTCWLGVAVTSAVAAAGLTLPAVAATPPATTDGPGFFPVTAASVEPVGTPGDVRVALRRDRTPKALANGAGKAKVGDQVLQIVDGISVGGSDGVSLAVGPQQMAQIAGRRVNVYTKSTGATVTEKSTKKLFGSLTHVKILQSTIVYDPVGRRFVAVGVTKSGGDRGLVMRISKSSTAAPFRSSTWLDPVTLAAGDAFAEANPRIGISQNKIAITATTNNPSTPNRIFFLPRSAYYQGNDPGAWAANLDAKYNGQAPAVNQSRQPNLFVAIPDVGDVTVTTYAGAVAHKKPLFSKNVMYPSNPLSAPPLVATGGDTLDLGGLNFSGVTWRQNQLWAAATVSCGSVACVRVFGVKTANGVSLMADHIVSNTNRNRFSPALALDAAGNLHLTATDVATTPSAPSQAVWVRKGSHWSKSHLVRRGDSPITAPPSGSTARLWNVNVAVTDPTSPRDVWVAGISGDASVGKTHVTTRIARVSVAKNHARMIVGTGAAGHARKTHGHRYSFTVRLTRPGGGTIGGLPVSLQLQHGHHWKTIRSAHTKANGTFTWTLKLHRSVNIRGLGAGRAHHARGLAFSSVVTKPTRVGPLTPTSTVGPGR